MAGSFAALLEAIDTYTQETVHPVTAGMLGLTDRWSCVVDVWRMNGASTIKYPDQRCIDPHLLVPA